MIYLLIILIAVVLAAFLIPIKVVIYTKIKGNNVYYVDNTNNKNEIKLVVKILRFIPVYVYKNNKKKIKKTDSANLEITDIVNILKESLSGEKLSLNTLIKKIFKWGKKIKFNKMILIGGFNTEDYVKNAYINASINSLICMFINGNQNNFNLNKLYYQISISDYNYYLILDTVLSFPVISNIHVLKTIISIVHKFKKEKNKKEESGKNTKQNNNCFRISQSADLS